MDNEKFAGRGIVVGDTVLSPRFGDVRIVATFADVYMAEEAGYTEPAHVFDIEGWRVAGKHTRSNRLPIFAAYRYE